MYLNQKQIIKNPLLHQFLNESNTRPLSDDALKRLCKQESFNEYLIEHYYVTINLVMLVCIQGDVAPLKDLASRGPIYFKIMLNEHLYDAFRVAVEKGHLPIIQYLAEEAPDKLQAMIQANDYCIFRVAAQNGHLSILQYLAKQAPDKFQAMIQANKYFAFRLVAENGNLPVLQYLTEQAPDKLQAMIEANEYGAFQEAAGKGHIHILQYLAEQAPSKLQAMIEEDDCWAFQWAAINKNYTVVHFILEKAEGLSKELSKTLVNKLTQEQKDAFNTLRYESSVIHHTLIKDNLLPNELIEWIQVRSNLFPFFKPVKQCLESGNTNQIVNSKF